MFIATVIVSVLLAAIALASASLSSGPRAHPNSKNAVLPLGLSIAALVLRIATA